MPPRCYLTTSWDDGHPLDLRLAEMLAKHGIPATFYIPKSRGEGKPTLHRCEVAQLAQGFEIGSHTLSHVRLPALAHGDACLEVKRGKEWVEDVTGLACRSFAFPGGRFRARHLQMVRAAGFRLARTVELLSLAPPRRGDGVFVMATTVQVHEHSWLTYLGNAARRLSSQGLRHCVLSGIRGTWSTRAAALLERARKSGGVFHLWGHSEEVERHGLWKELEDVLRMIPDNSDGPFLGTNWQVCQALGQGTK